MLQLPQNIGFLQLPPQLLRGIPLPDLVEIGHLAHQLPPGRYLGGEVDDAVCALAEAAEPDAVLVTEELRDGQRGSGAGAHTCVSPTLHSASWTGLMGRTSGLRWSQSVSVQ